MVIDIMLRTASVAVFLVVLHQLVGSKGGSLQHNTMGVVAVALGIVIAALVSFRAGARQEAMEGMYILHLFIGGLFFISLFTTGYLGWRVRTNRSLSPLHSMCGRTTLGLLLLTLFVGILSRISH